MPSRPMILRVRMGLGLAVVGPALALGGVWPWVIPGFAIVIAATLHGLHRRGRALRLPLGAALGLLAAAATLVQLLPIPGLRAELAPELHAWIEHARLGLPEPGWPSLSPTPVDTGFELVRLLALTGLALVAAQLGWRTTARALVVVGVAVAAIGLVQHGLGLERIYGLYQAHQLPEGRTNPALLSTFVNPNHQSGLLLVTAFATAAALLSAAREGRLESRVVLGMALVLQLAALVLSQSRAAVLSGLVVGALASCIAWWPTAARAPRRTALALAGGLVLGLLSLGLWHELSTLLEADTLDATTAARLRVTSSAPALIELSPLAGLGRGAFGDVFPAFDPEPSHVWFSHLECAPLTLLVEWGLPAGGLLLVLLPAWWLHAMRHAGRHEDARARRVALLGLLALALQSLADFSLEFLGVAAPACALAGALSAPYRAALHPRWLRGAAIGLAGLGVAAVPFLASTWAFTWAAPAPDVTLAARPLHAPLHRQRAREAARVGDFVTVEQRARVAVRLQPGNVDGWLLLASAAQARGDRAAERRATKEALARLHRLASPALVEHLVRQFPAPIELAALAPAAALPWEHLMGGLLVHAPRHAEALAAARAARDPDDPRPLRHRFEVALTLEQPALALHHARLWRALDPHDPHAHLAVARALQAHPEPRTTELREALELALLEVDPHDAKLRGAVEEQLLRALLRPGAPVAPERLRALARALRARPTDEATHRRRLALLEPLLADEP